MNGSDEAWRAALRGLGELYAELDEELERRSPRCDLSGVCCDFDAAGHRLFATDLEVRFALTRAGGVPAASAGTCPFWRGRLCTLRRGRPLSCRIYFCDASFADEMRQWSERYHRRVRALHERYGIPYRYGPFPERVRTL